MERVAVNAQVEIVKPRSQRQAVACADGNRRDPAFIQLLAGVEKFIPRFRFALDTGLLEQIPALSKAISCLRGSHSPGRQFSVFSWGFPVQTAPDGRPSRSAHGTLLAGVRLLRHDSIKASSCSRAAGLTR